MYCRLLKKDASEREVYFQLGQPARVEGTKRYWHAYKDGKTEVIAEIQEKKLVHLVCPGNKDKDF